MQRAPHILLGTALLSCVFLLCIAANAQSPFAGRWDLTITTHNGAYPSWLEYADEGATPAIRVVGRTGSVHAVREAKVAGSHLIFADPQSSGDGRWDLMVKDRKLAGRSLAGDVAGVPAQMCIRDRLAAAGSAPRDTAVKNKIGQTLLSYGAIREAADIFRDVMKTDDRNADAYAGLGSADLALENYEEARDAFREALQRNPSDELNKKQLDLSLIHI